jgi:predicted ATP-dependent protease
VSLAASLTFEQSYEGVDGDSASAAELLALLSALADVPLRQDLAMTGSVNQHGMIQPIGGVNEKIEGFFTTCRQQGLTGEQGVLIPAANVRNLMLRQEVIEAVGQGRFHVWPVKTIDEAMSLFTGMEPGRSGVDGEFPEGTLNRLVQTRLADFTREVKENDFGSRENGHE